MANWMPHGHCVNWNAYLLAGEVASNLVIALSYFAIPVALVIIARRYPGFKAGPVLWMFAAFIVSCGATHVMDIITIWVPCYWLDMWVRAFTAVSSVVTAFVLWWLSPMLVDFLPRAHGRDAGGPKS
jgi:hypothetical protein